MAAATHAVLIWGAGGHGRVVADVARAAGVKVAGFIDRDAGRIGTRVGNTDAEVVAGEAAFLSRLTAGMPLPCGATVLALGVGDNRTRSACRAKLDPSALPPLIHPSAVVSPSAVVGPGAVIMPRVVVNAGAVIGAGAIVNSAAVVEHDCVVGDDAHISPGAVLAGGARVGAGAWVGANATVLPLIEVGEWAVVGAGSTVTRNVAPGSTVVGTPARPLTRSAGRSESPHPK
jgi:sugar O-acyltransferase (sialic acid O-acetyltransferase NeuD family)